MDMMFNRILYECLDEESSENKELQEKMGLYDLVGFKTFKTGVNTSEKSPVYLHSKLVDGHALAITYCGSLPSGPVKRQWVGWVSIPMYDISIRIDRLKYTKQIIEG